jgi:hypothetical protein
MIDNVSIQIWTRGFVPERNRQFATHYDDGEIENTVFVAHVPAAVLQDRLLKQCTAVSEPHGYLWWQSQGLFGTNCMDTFPDPAGDGIVVVGGWI